MGDEPKSGLPETLATAYDPGMCLLALPVIRMKGNKKACGKDVNSFFEKSKKIVLSNPGMCLLALPVIEMKDCVSAQW